MDSTPSLKKKKKFASPTSVDATPGSRMIVCRARENPASRTTVGAHKRSVYNNYPRRFGFNLRGTLRAHRPRVQVIIARSAAIGQSDLISTASYICMRRGRTDRKFCRVFRRRRRRLRRRRDGRRRSSRTYAPVKLFNCSRARSLRALVVSRETRRTSEYITRYSRLRRTGTSPPRPHPSSHTALSYDSWVTRRYTSEVCARTS